MKEILVCCWLFDGIQLLIPKKKGIGFLKSPCGHHHEQWMHDIEYDAHGLDGYIDIRCSCHEWEVEKRDAILKHLMPKITKRFPFPWKIVESSEFKKLLR